MKMGKFGKKNVWSVLIKSSVKNWYGEETFGVNAGKLMRMSRVINHSFLLVRS